ncbi:hypothetical protein H8356DRAFT_1435854 [Neocallimastix lanati (nom. inval.)]|nr:hypothetical protein H8356DRAFT_1435854 [Neocallimastix sp. JGI-2020a]
MYFSLTSTPKWYDIGTLYVDILIQPLYKVCLVLVVCCGWDYMIRLTREKIKTLTKNIGRASSFSLNGIIFSLDSLPYHFSADSDIFLSKANMKDIRYTLSSTLYTSNYMGKISWENENYLIQIQEVVGRSIQKPYVCISP